LRYLLHLPPGHEQGGRRWPVVLCLHGAAERGEEIQRVLRHGLPREVQTRVDYPAIVVAPQCPGQTTWLDHLQGLLELLAEVESRLHGDADAVHVTGLSMGGMGTWALGVCAPGRFASLVPVCGLVPPIEGFHELLENLRDKRVWAFHGVLDPVVSVEETLGIVSALKRLGGRPRVTLYPDVGHRAWERAYADDELLRWFLG
jgi:predicted peptidase